MTITESDLLTAAMELDAHARARIGERLLASVADPSSANLSPAWTTEIHRRLEAYDSGKVAAIPGHQVIAELKAKYGG